VLIASIAGIAFLIVDLNLDPATPILLGFAFAFLLIFLAAAGGGFGLLPDVLTGALLFSGLMVNSYSIIVSPPESVIGAVAGYAVLWALARAVEASTGKASIGNGDLKMCAGLGAWLGWHSLPLLIFLFASLGTVGGAVRSLRSGDSFAGSTIATGPYWATVGFIAFLWGEHIVRTWSRLMGGS
jgi:leader peptidase (prepilin peptidase)/N-methyltransferase